MDSTARRTPLGAAADAGGIVLGWLTQVTVLLAVVGLIAFDGISIITSRLSLEDVGDQAARSASETWQRTHDIQASLLSAQTTATQANADTSVVSDSLRVDPDGTAHLTVTRTASTLVAQYLPPVRGWCDQRVEGDGRSTA
jgi:Flp pilus assembly protein TadG